MTLNRRRNWKVAQNISKANCKLWAYSLSACSSDSVDPAPLANLRIVCCNYADHGAPAPKSRTPLLLLLLLHSKRKPISDQLQPPLHCGIFFQIVAVRPCAISDLGLWRRRWNNEKPQNSNSGSVTAVWCSGKALVSINAVALHRARLVLGWMTAFGQVNCLIT